MQKTGKIIGALVVSLAFAGPLHAEDPTADTIVATVNGEEITLGHMIALRETLPANVQGLDDTTLFDGILEQMIQQAALAETAADDLTKRDTLALDNQRRGYLAGVALNSAAEAAVTDEALQSLYDEKYKAFEPTKEYHAAHILVATEEEAKDIKAELDGGADFAALAKEKSTGPSGPNGGDLGWFGPGMMVKPFEDAVMALEAGGISDPVETQFGWHVINLMETRNSEAPDLDTVRDELAGELQGAAVEARVTELTETATVEKSVEGIDPAIIRDSDLLGN